jgi:L-alanine-DL-glutamate epimerase-like enolase superfamily enzyme
MSGLSRQTNFPIKSIKVSAYSVPTDFPEADGTVAWDSTTLALVEPSAGGKTGLGFGYSDTATARFINDVLLPILIGKDALAINELWLVMVRAVRNHGRPGVASMAISAVDNALWDLKARLLDLPLATLLGPVRAAIPVYGSGGFTSYPDTRLRDQLAGWVCGCASIPAVNLEYFHDHARIEQMLFDGALTPVAGVLYPDLNRPGFGLEFKRTDAASYAI